MNKISISVLIAIFVVMGSSIRLSDAANTQQNTIVPKLELAGKKITKIKTPSKTKPKIQLKRAESKNKAIRAKTQKLSGGQIIQQTVLVEKIQPLTSGTPSPNSTEMQATYHFDPSQPIASLLQKLRAKTKFSGTAEEDFYKLIKKMWPVNGQNFGQNIGLDGKLDEMIAILNEFLSKYPDSQYTDDIQLLIAEAYFIYRQEYMQERNIHSNNAASHLQTSKKTESYDEIIVRLRSIADTNAHGKINEMIVLLTTSTGLDNQWELLDFKAEIPTKLAALSTIVSIRRNTLVDFIGSNQYSEEIIQTYPEFRKIQAYFQFLIASGYQILGSPTRNDEKAYGEYKKIVDQFLDITYFSDIALCALMEGRSDFNITQKTEAEGIIKALTASGHFLNETRWCSFPGGTFTKDENFRVAKWDKTKLSFFIKNAADDKVNLIKQAFAKWSAKMNGLFTFVQEKREESADIVVIMNDGPVGFGVASSGLTLIKMSASTENQRGRSIIEKVGIGLDAQVDNSDYFLPVILHEIGHALGLGHSGKAGDIMSGGNNISARDVKTVEYIYED